MFFRDVLKIFLGTGFAQVVTIAISPILTRLFSPDDFGVIAVYGAIVSVFATVSTLRYEQTIILPASEKEANYLVILSIAMSCVVGLFLYVLILFFSEQITLVLGIAIMKDWLYLIPLSVFLNGLYQTYNYYHIRKKQFGRISQAQVTQSIVTASNQLMMGNFSYTGGLIWGQMIGLLFGTLVFSKGVFKSLCLNIKDFKFSNLCFYAKKYKKYPTLSVFGALANSVSTQLPILILVRYFSESIVGVYSFSYRIVTLPTSIIGQAVSQVFLQKVVFLQSSEPEKLYREVSKVSGVLFLLIFPMVVVMWFWGDILFAFIFGEEWRMAGEIAALLSIAVAFRFPVSSISSVLILDATLKVGTLWQALYLITLTTILLLFGVNSFDNFVCFFVIHEVLLSIIYFFLILKGINILCSKKVKVI